MLLETNMAKNKLLAFGCSYTEHYEHSMWAMGVDHSFPRWPKLLADKLDMECVNRCPTGSIEIIPSR